MNDIIINAICTLAGALGLKIFDSLHSTKKESIDNNIALIEKLQEQVNILFKRIDEVQAQLDNMIKEKENWRNNYYKLLNKYYNLLSKYKPNFEDPEHPNT
jgi:DNA-binding transcriptional regulator GbsR (MarR family)